MAFFPRGLPLYKLTARQTWAVAMLTPVTAVALVTITFGNETALVVFVTVALFAFLLVARSR